MNFYQEIDAIANDCSHTFGIFNGIAHLLDVGLEVNLIVAFIEKRIEVPKSRKARIHFDFAFDQHLFDRVFVDMTVNARLGPRGAT